MLRVGDLFTATYSQSGSTNAMEVSPYLVASMFTARNVIQQRLLVVMFQINCIVIVYPIPTTSDSNVHELR